DELVSMKEIAEAAVFGKPDTVKGDAIIAFVTLKDGYEKSSELIEKIKRKVRNDLGPIMVPEEIHIVNSLPKTRSGKIMRRLIRSVYLGEEYGDTSTLENEASLNDIKSIKIR
ncbi:MAG: acetyl-coenzyme A synthetase, partial [Acidiplasma aeolicum]